GLFESLVSGWGQTTYSYVAIDASQDADAITDRQVAQVIGRADSDEYKNNRLGYEMLIQELLLRITFTLVLCGMGTVLSLIIFCHLQATRRREQQAQWELLMCLGMKKRWRQRFAIADAMIPALVAIGMVTLILNLFYNYVHNITNMRLGWKFIWNFLVGIDVSWYCVICIVYLIIVLCAMQVSGRKVTAK
ncbi:MAG: hypothetical protein PUB22_10105, partial [Clostridiales bacterium]|nr:hypothetical protein [Clostridiales bacterium]